MKNTDKCMDGMKKEALKAAREIAVKFIETGRLSPANFQDIFPGIYNVVLSSINHDGQFPCSAEPKAGLEDK